MRIDIKSKKKLYKLLSIDLQPRKVKKVIGKIFSIGRSNYWKVELENNVLFFTFENDLIKCTGNIGITGNIKMQEIQLRNITFKQSELTVDMPYNNRHNYFLTSDYKILSTRVISYNSVVQLCNANKRSDIIAVECYNEKNIYSFIIKNNPSCFRKLDYKEYGSYAGVLCIEDCGCFTKGMIIDTTYDGYFWHNYTPLRYIKDSLYSINNTISSNLGLVTLQELEDIDTATHSCIKQQFGCQRGCTSSCEAVSANNRTKHLKNTFMKLWKEVFEK